METPLSKDDFPTWYLTYAVFFTRPTTSYYSVLHLSTEITRRFGGPQNKTVSRISIFWKACHYLPSPQSASHSWLTSCASKSYSTAKLYKYIALLESIIIVSFVERCWTSQLVHGLSCRSPAFSSSPRLYAHVDSVTSLSPRSLRRIGDTFLVVWESMHKTLSPGNEGTESW